MSGSQKVLRVFGVFEVLIAIYYAYLGIMGDNVSAFVSVALYLLTAILMFVAAKDATKAGGAFLITLVSLVLSIIELLFALSGGGDTNTFIAGVVAIILNLIAFIAAGNVRRQGRR